MKHRHMVMNKYWKNDCGNGTLLGIVFVAVLSCMSVALFIAGQREYSTCDKVSQEIKLRTIAEWAADCELEQLTVNREAAEMIYESANVLLLAEGKEANAEYFVYGRYHDGIIELWIVAEENSCEAQIVYLFDYDKNTGTLHMKGMG